VVHRDLKPENILFDGEVIKLIDFGNSSKLESFKKLSENKGSAYYIAPEVLDGSYDEKCDVWSCGVILYIMLSGDAPFNGNSEEEILVAIKRGFFNFDFTTFSQISDYAKKLISKMLTYNPKKRPSVAEVLDDHWFKAIISKKETLLNSTVLTNLKNFGLKSRMQEAIYYFIVNNMANKDEKRELMETFKMLDANNDGVVTKDELIVGLKKANMFINETEVDKLMDQIDHNKDRIINYTEFVAAAIDKKRLLTDERVRQCFRIFDKDGSGKISLIEFRDVFQGKNKVDPKVWEELVKEIDIDGDGEIELDEFKTILNKLI
jgi:calcium-dependent protein kinase